MVNRALILAVGIAAGAAGGGADAGTPRAGLIPWEVVREFPHNTLSYTEGLVYDHGRIYESVGRDSALQIDDLRGGAILQRVPLESTYFGEGLAHVGHRWLQLTWTSHIGFIYDEKLHRTGSFHYSGEGWGLTWDGHRLIMSDGSATLRLLDPKSLEPAGSLTVRDGDQPVERLNELEYVNGRIYANVWMTNGIAAIDAASGRVLGWLDMSPLLDRFRQPFDWQQDDVLNGIAWDPQTGHLFVTGKCWPKLFEIRLKDGAR